MDHAHRNSLLAVYNTVRPYKSLGYLTPVDLAGRPPRSDSSFAIIDSTFRENSAQEPPVTNYSMLLIPNGRISRVSAVQNQLFLGGLASVACEIWTGCRTSLCLVLACQVTGLF